MEGDATAQLGDLEADRERAVGRELLGRAPVNSPPRGVRVAERGARDLWRDRRRRDSDRLATDLGAVAALQLEHRAVGRDACHLGGPVLVETCRGLAEGARHQR